MIFHTTPLYDVGKIGILDGILQKLGKLADEERKVMKTYPEIGARIIVEGKNEIMTNARSISLSHHEKWDGNGFPAGKKGKEIPLFGRIIVLADVFNALTNDRPYKEAWPVEGAISLIQDGSGTHFDPIMAETFLAIKSKILKIRDQYSKK